MESKDWIEKVVTKSEHYSQSLKLCWLQKGNLIQVLINFCFENEYRNVIWCDENSRNACHKVLKKLWKNEGVFFRNGYRNSISFDKKPKISEMKTAEVYWQVWDSVRKELKQKIMMVCVIRVLKRDESFLMCVNNIAVFNWFSLSCVDDMSVQYRMNCSYLDDFNESANCMRHTKLAMSI